VASYRAGAFRATIVATWIAVCFDLIEKLRELALTGDKEAEKQVQDLEMTRRTGDPSRALKFERELLAVAKDKFELLSPLEFIDLERLQADRNRCAHPSLTVDEKAYSPSAELARLHIHSAVTHLLQHPPAQGKFALDRLRAEIESDYFPANVEGAKVVFSSGPLRRPRESLVRNLVVILVKAILKEKPEYKRRARLTAALDAIELLHPESYVKILKEVTSKIFRSIDDENIHSQINFLNATPRVWQYLDADVQQRVKNYVSDLPSAEIEELPNLLRLDFFKLEARRRLKKITQKEINDAMFFDLHEELGDAIIEKYLRSSSFDEANEWARQLSFYATDFSKDQVCNIIAGIPKNNRIIGSYQMNSLLNTLRSKNKFSNGEFDELLQVNGLK
jgi:hypothetical protein